MTGVLAVFGGRSEIGLAIARRLAPEASVVVLASRPDPIPEFAEIAAAARAQQG